MITIKNDDQHIALSIAKKNKEKLKWKIVDETWINIKNLLVLEDFSFMFNDTESDKEMLGFYIKNIETKEIYVISAIIDDAKNNIYELNYKILGKAR